LTLKRLRKAIRLAIRLAAHPALQALLRDKVSPIMLTWRGPGVG